MYVEKHIRSQIKQLYKDVLSQKFNSERQTFKNSLSIATQSPDEFAYDLMKGPGYMAVVAGEVVHIVKCVPAEIKMDHGKSCYAELQITRNNKTYFLTPRTHILKTHATDCYPLNTMLVKNGTKYLHSLLPQRSPQLLSQLQHLRGNKPIHHNLLPTEFTQNTNSTKLETELCFQWNDQQFSMI